MRQFENEDLQALKIGTITLYNSKFHTPVWLCISLSLENYILINFWNQFQPPWKALTFYLPVDGDQVPCVSLPWCPSNS